MKIWVSVEDLAFAKRLKAYGKSQRKAFHDNQEGSHHHVVPEVRCVWRLVSGQETLVWCVGFFSGKSQKDADDFYYNVGR